MSLKLAIQIVMGVSLISCNTNNTNDVKQFVTKTKQSHDSHIEQLPKLVEYEQNNYNATNLNDPFHGPKGHTIVQISNEQSAIRVQQQKPDYDRPKEYLENFPLDSLTMVGTVQKNGETWALIVDRASVIHRVKLGSYLGENSGKITQITDDNILLKELVPDGQGGWIDRETNVSITKR